MGIEDLTNLTTEQLLSRLYAVYPDLREEVRRRLELWDAQKADARTEIQKSFSFSAGVVIYKLWEAYTGWQLTADEAQKVGAALHALFLDLQNGRQTPPASTKPDGS